MSLLQLGDITLHSGRRSSFKIDCEAMDADGWWAVARMFGRILPPFSEVEGVPCGGLALANAFEPARSPGVGRLLVVDDVWTTGGSMEAHRSGRDAIGAVLFARGPVAPWVTALFTLHEGLWMA